ncbi:hypothetical protein [Pseudorhodoferax sp.]|uniref:hypothetical protein n=1 Tax=Pseudorhodoferax sp. TaxID=1993553 RepID=UPI002DD68096|nr:hypothetical protein [Pseudorhodoferax sp.]
MRGWRRLALACVLAGLATGQAAHAEDALKSPACLAARERLDAIMAQDKPDIVPLRAARQRAARACFREEADAIERPSRLDRPQLPVPQTAGRAAMPPDALPAPAAPAAVAPPPAPQPNQAARCDAGGCWDSNGQRLNRSGNYLVNPQGQLCTQQGAVLSCP